MYYKDVSYRYRNKERKGDSVLEVRKHVRQPYYKLIDFMRRNNIKHREMAGFLGKSPSAFSQNINGTGADFSLNEARSICSKWGLNIDEYFNFF